MQKVAAYLMERLDGMNWPEARSAEVASLRSQVEKWLKAKGASEIAPVGMYQAEDGSSATFSIEEAADGDRTWWLARLQEVTAERRRFLAAVSITNGDKKVSVYTTLELGSDVTSINPLEADPRCPKIIRTMLQSQGRWYHGFTELRGLRRIQGFKNGESVAEEIKHPDRTVPLVVISDWDKEAAIPGLAESLSYDLAGIANVALLDHDATWALTDYLGSRLSCHSGAVRLYWPKLSIKEDPYRHPLWTSARLRAAGSDPTAIQERFRKQLRGLIMHASALSVVRPREIDEIRGNASRKILLDLKERATSLQDYAELADLYVKDNDELRVANAELTNRIDELQLQVAKLESDRQALLAHLRAKGTTQPEPDPDEITPDAEEDSEELEPASGEVRFYKKKYSTSDHDVMLRVQDCGHNKWQGAHSADKAKKGIAKLEDKADWQTVQHCAVCTGGGMWRVRW